MMTCHRCFDRSSQTKLWTFCVRCVAASRKESLLTERSYTSIPVGRYVVLASAALLSPFVFFNAVIAVACAPQIGAVDLWKKMVSSSAHKHESRCAAMQRRNADSSSLCKPTTGWFATVFAMQACKQVTISASDLCSMFLPRFIMFGKRKKVAYIMTTSTIVY